MSCEICGAKTKDLCLVCRRHTEGERWHVGCANCTVNAVYWLEIEDYVRDREDWDRHLRERKAWWNPAVDQSFNGALERSGAERLARKLARRTRDDP